MTSHSSKAPPSSARDHARELADRLLNSCAPAARAVRSGVACAAGRSPGELTNRERRILEALWGLFESDEKHPTSQPNRSVTSSRRRSDGRPVFGVHRTLARLAGLDYVTELHMQQGYDGPVIDPYIPLRKPGEVPPAICRASPFLMWLWDGRRSKQLSFNPHCRRVGIGNWYRMAEPWEWAWLTSRPPLGPDARPHPRRPRMVGKPANRQHDGGTSMSPTELVARIRQFVPIAARSVGQDLVTVSRSVRYAAQQIPKSITTAWGRSDPVGWRKRMELLFAHRPEFAAAREQEKQRLAQARGTVRLSHGASFSGTLHVRPRRRSRRPDPDPAAQRPYAHNARTG